MYVLQTIVCIFNKHCLESFIEHFYFVLFLFYFFYFLVVFGFVLLCSDLLLNCKSLHNYMQQYIKTYV